LVEVAEGAEDEGVIVSGLVCAEDEDVVSELVIVVAPLVTLVIVVPPLSLVAGVEEALAAVDVNSLEPELVADALEAAADVEIERILVVVGAEVAVRVVLPETHNSL
jgi:hypothetical protein